MMRSDAWPQHCRAALVRAVGAAATQFPGPGEEAPKRVHDVRKILKEARAIARLFLLSVGEPGGGSQVAIHRNDGRSQGKLEHFGALLRGPDSISTYREFRRADYGQ